MADIKKKIKSFIDFMFLPLAGCPLPAKKPDDFYHFLSSGKFNMEMMGSKLYGIPYGRDILVILWLIRKALEGGSKRIENPTIYDFLNTFELGHSKINYQEWYERFLRVFHTKWTWWISEETLQIGKNMNIVKDWMVIFDPTLKNKAKDMNIDIKKEYLFQQFIELSEDFFNTVVKHKIPYDLDVIIKIKDKPAVMNLYLWLNYRTYSLWLNKKEGDESAELFVPFFGENGLKKQLGSTIKKNNNFKMKFIGWLETLRGAWKNCPAYIEPLLNSTDKKKKLKDGLTVRIESIEQLSVLPDVNALRSRAVRKKGIDRKKALPGGFKRKCPECGDLLDYRQGKEMADGQRLDNYFRCIPCGKNFYKSHYPLLYQWESLLPD
ncbi:MAG: replication initiator protein A [Candidatus Aminicenantes bacterium]|nr:replication initiator protein A [Candidatus Aminicenantes bacterium]